MGKVEVKIPKISSPYLSAFFFFFMIVRSFSNVFVNYSFGQMRFNISSLMGVVFIGMLIVFLVKKIRVLPIGKVFFIWVLICFPFAVLSVINFGFEGFVGIREWVRLLSVFAVFFISFQLAPSFENKKYLKYSFAFFLIPFSVALFQLMTHTGCVQYGMHRIYGTMSDPNNFSLLIVIFYALTWFFLLFSNKKVLWGALIVLEELALVNTVSMTGYIMFFLINFFFFVNKLINRKKKYFLIFLVLIFVSLASYNKSYQVKFEKTMEDTLNYKEPGNSLSWRIYNWKKLVLIWKQKPYFGYGLNSVSIVNSVRTSAGAGYASHNDYIKYLVETGVVGLMIYLSFLVYVLASLYKIYKATHDCELKYLMYILLMVFLVMQVGSLSCNFDGATFSQYCFWAICGIGLKLCYRGQILDE